MAARSDGAFFPVTAQQQRKNRPVPDLERRLGRVTKSGPLRTSIPAFPNRMRLAPFKIVPPVPSQSTTYALSAAALTAWRATTAVSQPAKIGKKATRSSSFKPTPLNSLNLRGQAFGSERCERPAQHRQAAARAPKSGRHPSSGLALSSCAVQVFGLQGTRADRPYPTRS